MPVYRLWPQRQVQLRCDVAARQEPRRAASQPGEGLLLTEHHPPSVHADTDGH